MNAKHNMQPIYQTVQDQWHDLTCKGPAMTSIASSDLFARFAVVLILLSFLSACSQSLRTPADSVQTTLGGGTSFTSAEIVPKGKIILEGIQFKNDGSRLRPDSQPIVDSAATLLKSQPDIKVYVDAYCDPTGGKRLNLRLSQLRAATVTAYLEGHGIASDRLTPRGFGATHFIASNDTADGRAQNSRVELTPID